MRKFLTWLTIAVVAIVAYICGTKAGRVRYHEVTATLDALWNDPRVKKARKKAVKRADKAVKAAEKKAKKVRRKV